MEYEFEPVRGLPGNLPEGERILWQGAPEWRRLAREAFKTLWIGGYFALLLIWALIEGNVSGAVMTVVVGAAGLAILHGLAWFTARSTVYTITNKRVVMRFGIAIPKAINLPMVAIATARIRRNADGSGDIPLMLGAPHRLGYLIFWPHARPWKIGRPEPMLRALADVDTAAGILGAALKAALPEGRRTAIETLPPALTPGLVPA